MLLVLQYTHTYMCILMYIYYSVYYYFIKLDLLFVIVREESNSIHTFLTLKLTPAL